MSTTDLPWADRLTVAVTREVFISHAIQDVFDFVAAEDVLPKILTGYGMVPGVASTSDISGRWDRPGSHRVVNLADGSTATHWPPTWKAPWSAATPKAKTP